MPGSEAVHRLVADIPKLKAEYEQRLQVASGSRSSNKVGGRRKRKKSRKKKVLETSSSTFSRRVVDVRHQGMHEGEFTEEVTI